jgi:hypothetical protein
MRGGRVRRLIVARESGLSRAALRWGERRGDWIRIDRGIYAQGSEPPTAFDRQRARVLASGGVASARLAGVLYKLDAVMLDNRSTRRTKPTNVVVVEGLPCPDGLQTMIDLAALVDDDTWEQALESALRKKLTTVDALVASLPELGATRTPGTTRIRRVLALRPPARLRRKASSKLSWSNWPDRSPDSLRQLDSSRCSTNTASSSPGST